LERSNDRMEGRPTSSRNGAAPEHFGAPRPDRDTQPGRRLAAAPISWGVCEVPGWGRQLPPERVLAEMASIGIAATELGPIGYLPLDPDRLREALDRHGLRLVAAFVPLVLHERSLEQARGSVEEVADTVAAAGGEVLSVVPVMDAGWSDPAPLDDVQWRRLVDHLAEIDELVTEKGLSLAVHPHAGTLIQRAADVERLLADSDARWCLDTGHLAIGGMEAAEFVREHGDRIVHVHLKDVDRDLAAQVGSGALSLLEGTRRGLFLPLGRGDAAIGEVVGLLDRHGYERWLVLEQDTTITGQEPPVGRGPVLEVQASIEYLASLAPANRGGISQQ
jgi:inosose dehydratase